MVATNYSCDDEYRQKTGKLAQTCKLSQNELVGQSVVSAKNMLHNKKRE
jgi:hypothetical protein